MPGAGNGSSEPLGPAQRVALGAIRGYKVLFSPHFAGSCRFVPSCADYAAVAIARYGVIRGGWLAARRLARCHPLGGHGLDNVPAASTRPAGDSPGTGPRLV